MPLIGLAPQKGTVSVYIAAMKNDKPILEVSTDKLGTTSCKKACARIRKIKGMNRDEWHKMLRDAVQYNRGLKEATER